MANCFTQFLLIKEKLAALFVFYIFYSFEPGHEKMCLTSYVINKGADQPAHPRSLSSAFVVHFLDSIISLDYIAEISRL